MNLAVFLFTLQAKTRIGMRKPTFKHTALLCIFFASAVLFAQQPAAIPVSGMKPKELPPKVLSDSIVSIINLRNQKDSIKIKDIAEIKLFTKLPADSLKVLYANGVVIANLTEWKVKNNNKVVQVKFDDEMQDVLVRFLESNAFEKAVMPVYFSVGSKTQQLVTAKEPVYIEIRQKINIWWIRAISVIMIILIVAALRNNILRDDNNLYYSLGRTQLFYWTILVVIAYLYICWQTCSLPDVPGSIIAILGISVATTATSKVLENDSKKTAPVDKTAKSEGFFMDILSDGSSINIQRFQNVLFNAFFGIIFLQKVFATQLMPDFDNNVLLLLGISAGAYAGLKTTEDKKEQPVAPVEGATGAGNQLAAQSEAQAAAAKNEVPAENVAGAGNNEASQEENAS